MSDEKAKAVRGYCMYDWGKSAFETSVTAAILPPWFAYLFLEANGLTTTIANIELSGSAMWSYSVALGTLMVAFVSPSLGVIADRQKIKMWWLRILTYVGAGSTFLLALAGTDMIPISMKWAWLMVMFVFANIGLNGAGVFYNALLPHLGDNDEMDEISNKAFAYGYFGGGLLLVVHLGLVMGVTGDWVIPFCMASSGVWWFGFSLLTFKWIPEPPIENEMEKMSFAKTTVFAFKEVKSTLSKRKDFRTLFFFMVAYFLYIDGINTITAIAGIFGPVVLGLTTTDLIMTILVIQFVAAPCAIGFTKIAEKYSTKKALHLSLIIATTVGVLALTFAPLMPENHEDYDLQFTWDEDEEVWTVTTRADLGDLAQDPDHEEQEWANEFRDLLPVKQNEKVDEAFVLEWNITDDGPAIVTLSIQNASDLQSLKAVIEESRFSMSVDGQDEDDSFAFSGIDHPTNLGDGPLDFIAEGARDKIWQPLGISVTIQFLILGVLFGSIMGGSQGLSRSLFGQMVPETRSAEFFGFFGFFGKVAAFIGPFLYGTLAILFDDRVAILSIGLLILSGTVLMTWVDVEDGIAVANAEDARNRGLNSAEE
ncbi:MAG TPA: MFS transporter [Candidatus Thalassarchaeaceae archaeon]|nr:MFS transporter [Candidatus Thalassarchaeaceae archaeon]